MVEVRAYSFRLDRTAGLLDTVRQALFVLEVLAQAVAVAAAFAGLDCQRGSRG